MRNNFIFYASFYDALKDVDDLVRLHIYDAIALYVIEGAEPELVGVESALFKLIKPQLDANQKRYENGKKGGRENQDITKAEPKPNQDVTKTQPKPNQDITKAEPNKKENKKENKNVNVKENVLAKKSMDFYFQNIGVVAPATATEICSFIDDGILDEMILYALQKAVDANAKNWKYAKTIINSWVEKGISTLEQVKAEDVEFKNRKKPIAAKKEFPQHEYTQEQREQRKMDAYAEMEKIAGG